MSVTLEIEQLKYRPARRSPYYQKRLGEQGQIQPILVRPINGGGLYEVIDGNWRVGQALAEGFSTVEAEIRNVTAREAHLLALTSNIARSRNPMHEAEMVLALMSDPEHPLTEAQIAETIGCSVQTVKNLLKHFDLIEEFQDRLSDGEITRETAKAIARLNKADQRRLLEKPEISKAAVAELLKERQTELVWDIDVPTEALLTITLREIQLAVLDAGQPVQVTIGERTVVLRRELYG